MSVQIAFYKTVHEFSPSGAESLGSLMNLSPAVLRNKANPHNTFNKPLLAEADLVMGITGDYRILHALAANHGHVCYRLESDVPACDLAVLELITHLWRAHGDVGRAVDDTLADGRVDRNELAAVKAAVYKAIGCMQVMVARLEEMA